MAQDHPPRPGIAQHGGGDVPRVRAGRLRMAILPAHHHRRAGQGGGHRHQLRRGRADEQVAGGRPALQCPRQRRASAHEPFIFQLPAISWRIPPSRLPRPYRRGAGLAMERVRPYGAPLFAFRSSHARSPSPLRRHLARRSSSCSWSARSACGALPAWWARVQRRRGPQRRRYGRQPARGPAGAAGRIPPHVAQILRQTGSTAARPPRCAAA